MTSTIKVNNIQNQCGANIINESSNTITIGASGDTVTLASGASQSGFGRTGTVDWQTGSIKTSTFTAVNGEGYFCNTSGGAFTVNLPAGSAGAIVSVSDYTRTFQTNNLTVSPNGSEKIGGVAANATLSTEGQSATFVYVDGTEGWINVQETSNSVTGKTFITATGGTITTSGNDKIHTFTGPGTFTVSSISNAPENNQVSYLVVAGGASGGSAGDSSGGGGAGGFREDKSPVTPYTASPLAGAGAINVTATGFPITVGAGGGPGSGSNSVFSTITSAGGGIGGPNPAATGGIQGGSGGGGGSSGTSPGAGGPGNTPPVSPPQGNPGGAGRGCNSPLPGIRFGGGGGGAGGTGGSAGVSTQGGGGVGVSTSITGSSLAYAGGAGAGEHASPQDTTSFPNGSPCGTGGTGSNAADAGNRCATANRGGGGGGGSSAKPGIGYGGSGVVVIRYKYQ